MKKPEKIVQLKNSGNTLEFYPVSYPEQNPETALDDITDTLEYVGAFKNLKKPT